jgi:hypothetical protein
MGNGIIDPHRKKNKKLQNAGVNVMILKVFSPKKRRIPQTIPYIPTNALNKTICKLSLGLIFRGRLNGLTFPRNLPSQIVEGSGAVLKEEKMENHNIDPWHQS